MSILAVIPARGGSKRIPSKNIAQCAGKPLLAWTAEAALESSSIDRAILSTDDAIIADIGKAAGLEVPFLRPAHLAEDSTPMLPVLQHLLSWAEDTIGDIEAIILLQPSSPLRSARHIDEAVSLFRESKAESIVSVSAVPHQFSPAKLLRTGPTGELKSFLTEENTDLAEIRDETFVGRNGPAILICRPSLLKQGRLYGEPNIAYEMHPSVSIDIDEPWQLDQASCMLSSNIYLEK